MARRSLTPQELAGKTNLSLATIYNVVSGRAQNPSPKTIKALEKAVGSPFENKQETKEASEIAGIGQLIDFDPYDDREAPAKPGVYVLYDISQRPLYVGKAKEIRARIKSHRDRFWFKHPLVATGAYVEISDGKLCDQIETVLIQFLKNNAVINKQKTVRDED